MAEKQSDDTGIWLAVIVGAAALLYWYNKDDPPPPTPPPYVETTPSAKALDAAGDAVKQEPLPKPVLKPRFDAQENGVYFYLGAASEEERKQGIVAGPTFAYRYYGRNEKGEHVLRSYTANGYPQGFYYCSGACNLVRDEQGTRTVLPEASVIGSAFWDARNGFLKVSKRPATTQPVFVEPPVSEEQPQPDEPMEAAQ